jgi:hypothetical protein
VRKPRCWDVKELVQDHRCISCSSNRYVCNAQAVLSCAPSHWTPEWMTTTFVPALHSYSCCGDSFMWILSVAFLTHTHPVHTSTHAHTEYRLLDPTQCSYLGCSQILYHFLHMILLLGLFRESALVTTPFYLFHPSEGPILGPPPSQSDCPEILFRLHLFLPRGMTQLLCI